MLLTLGLLFLQLAGASLQTKDFYRLANHSMGSFYQGNVILNETSSNEENEIFIESQEFSVKETTFHRGDAEVTLREICLKKNNRKLLLLLENGILTDCNYENKFPKQCTEEILSSGNLKSSISLYKQENNSLSIITKFPWLWNVENLYKQCRDIKSRNRNQIIHQQRQWNQQTRLERFRKSEENHNRSRRDLFLIPGTKWCGKGYSATKYTSLGGFGTADSCCRKHDTSCPFWIPAFESRYGLYNWGVSTMMHCACDERFRTCLKMAQSSSANMVGKIFFNVIRLKCFILKKRKKKICKKWATKSKCLEYEKYKAVLKKNLYY
ncbi:uncharacterized protein LOC127278428 [Leptopilina boulardi]|uniref:uncharacterized protein LOC127278428 n=1 Tax=Leptopilina boulardi TaxID=63433 RepID=UPI0021F5572F|nr:uncharacterized protein LOC127278428 [Leptopilina boulardi]